MTVQEHLVELQAKKAKLKAAIASEIAAGSQECYVARQRLDTVNNDVLVFKNLFAQVGSDAIKQALEEKLREQAALLKTIEEEEIKPSQECLVLKQQLASVEETIKSLEAIASSSKIKSVDTSVDTTDTPTLQEHFAIATETTNTTDTQAKQLLQEKLQQAIDLVSEIGNIAEAANYDTKEIDAILGKLSRVEFVPQCCDRVMSKNGSQQGKQRYRCQSCGKTLTENAEAKGRKKQYVSNAEKQRAYRERIKPSGSHP